MITENKKKIILFITGMAMLLFAVGFVLYAMNHPERSFPWNNGITYIIYFLYIAVMVVCFVAAIRKKAD